MGLRVAFQYRTYESHGDGERDLTGPNCQVPTYLYLSWLVVIGPAAGATGVFRGKV